MTYGVVCHIIDCINTVRFNKMISARWYSILKLKKTQVIQQLIEHKITHTITSHIATLKSKLYQYIKKNVKPLQAQFKAIVGNDWEIAFNQSGKSFKQFRKDLLLRFHPDKHNGCAEATQITQTINSWEEPVKEIVFDLDFWKSIFSKHNDTWTGADPGF